VAYATSPTVGLVSAQASPAADPATNAQASNAGSFALIVPAADAERIGLAILLLAAGVALGMRAKGGSIFGAFPARAPRGAHHGSSVNRPKPPASTAAADKVDEKVGTGASDQADDKVSTRDQREGRREGR
jgi:hypothetical protein